MVAQKPSRCKTGPPQIRSSWSPSSEQPPPAKALPESAQQLWWEPDEVIMLWMKGYQAIFKQEPVKLAARKGKASFPTNVSLKDEDRKIWLIPCSCHLVQSQRSGVDATK